MLTDPHGLNSLTKAIIGCGIRVHETLGPGLLESVYSECMLEELHASALRCEVGRQVPIIYRSRQLKACYYMDLLVEEQVIVELKSVAELIEIHKKQLLTHLRLSRLPVGLLLNFNVVLLCAGGVKRVVNPAIGPRLSVEDLPETNPLR